MRQVYAADETWSAVDTPVQNQGQFREASRHVLERWEEIGEPRRNPGPGGVSTPASAVL